MTFQARVSEAMRSTRILTLDIETTPTLAWTFSTRKAYIGPEKIVEPSRMLCFAAKWYGADEVMFWGEWDGPEAMVDAAWGLLDKADILVTFNGRRFDEPILRTEFATRGLTGPTPYKSVDLFAIAKRQFRMESLSLNNLAQRLDVGAKAQTGGFDLWKQVIAGDPEARATMQTYNVQDVRLTEQLYDRMRGWMPNHPHLGSLPGSEVRCNQCGSTDLARADGNYRAVVIDYVLWTCRNCGAQVRSGYHSRAALTRGVS